MGHISRRGFLGTVSAAGGALTLGWPVPAAAVESLTPVSAGGAPLGIWVVIKPDDTTIIRIARSEMGQGTLTGLAQLVADELGADWSRVKTEYVPPEANHASKRAWGDMLTGGSQGIRMSVDYVRQGGAAARIMLTQAAAAQWGVAAADCRATMGAVTHAASNRSIRYGALAEAAAKLPVPANVPLKSPAEWTIIGKPLPRLDTVEKTNGSAEFAIDLKLPDMLLAAIAQSPVFGGKLGGFDAKSVATMPGVRHVLAVGDNAVAVVADTWWQAKTALEKLPITWDEGPNAGVSDKTIAAATAAGLDAAEAAVGNKQGDAPGVIGRAKRTVQATYGAPFLNHATLEPMNCTAMFKDGTVDVWVGTQNGEASLAAAAEAGGVPLERVRINKFLLGGGFGRRGAQDFTRQAVLLAKQVPGRPIKLIWSREEDMQHGYYRPNTQAKLTGALDEHGNLEALHVRLAGHSILAYLAPNRPQNGTDMLPFQGLTPSEFGYNAIPNLLIDYAMRNSPVPVGFWRGVNHNQNAIYVECFIDELALAAGKDPLEFRRTLLAKSPKHLAILNAVAAKAGWGEKLPEGVFRGLCQNCGFGSYTAAVAEVSVSPKGQLKVLRIVAATDPGYVVNPDQVVGQVEGSFAYGLSALLYSQNTIERGRVVEGNFDTYEVARMVDMPKVETILAPSGGFWGGVGEPTIAVAAPAVFERDFRGDRQADPNAAVEAARFEPGVMRRRSLLAGAAGAFTLGWAIPGGALRASAQAAPKGTPVGIWVTIHPDERVVVAIARSEMGQGTMTGLAQLVAEELEADWSKISTTMIPPHENFANKRAWGEMSTGGSRGIRNSVDYVRQGGAAARVMLVQAAANTWGVPAADCQAKLGVVTHTASGRTMTYGALAEAAGNLPVPKSVVLKQPAEWTIVGKPLQKLDAAEKLNGSQQYAIDLRLPGMLSAAIAQCPVFGGKLASFDAAATLAKPGVRHVLRVDERTVAVVADTWYQAKEALAALPIRWDEGAGATVDSAQIEARMREGLADDSAGAGHVIGDAKKALAGAAKRIEGTYATPFLNHATLEPMNCTARVDADQVEVWVGTQNGDASLAAAAEAAGLPPAKVRVNKFTLGGGFGRRGQQDYVRLAVMVAKQVPGVPIKVVWSREEDMQHGFYRPISQCRLQGGLDDKGAWWRCICA